MFAPDAELRSKARLASRRCCYSVKAGKRDPQRRLKEDVCRTLSDPNPCEWTPVVCLGVCRGIIRTNRHQGGLQSGFRQTNPPVS